MAGPITDVDARPRYEATGSKNLNIRDVHTRHAQLLSTLQEQMGGVGQREAIAALLEFYADEPDLVTSHTENIEFRRR